MKPSVSGSLNPDEWKAWRKNVLIYAVPAMIVIIPSVIEVIPSNWKYAALTIYVLNTLVDLGRKWLAGQSKS